MQNKIESPASPEVSGIPVVCFHQKKSKKGVVAVVMVVVAMRYREVSLL